MTIETFNKAILIVEDDPTYRHLWERLIQDLGIKKLWVMEDPTKATKIIQENQIDLMISDVVMPKMSGYELAKTAKNKNPKTEVLLTTGYQTDLSRFDLGTLRCHLLHKPYHNLNDVCTFLTRLLKGEDLFQGMDEQSFSENLDCPEITEWTL